MRPSDVANDPKLARDLIGIYEAGRRWVALEDRLGEIGTALDERDPRTGELVRDCLKSDDPRWPQFNGTYEQLGRASRVLRAAIKRVKA